MPKDVNGNSTRTLLGFQLLFLLFLPINLLLWDFNVLLFLFTAFFIIFLARWRLLRLLNTNLRIVARLDLP